MTPEDQRALGPDILDTACGLVRWSRRGAHLLFTAAAWREATVVGTEKLPDDHYAVRIRFIGERLVTPDTTRS